MCIMFTVMIWVFYGYQNQVQLSAESCYCFKRNKNVRQDIRATRATLSHNFDKQECHTINVNYCIHTDIYSVN